MGKTIHWQDLYYWLFHSTETIWRPQLLEFFAPIQDSRRGFAVFLRGISWLRKNPRYFFYLSIPTLVGLFTLMFSLGYIWNHEDLIMSSILFTKPDSVLMLSLYYFCKALLYVTFFILSFVITLLVVNIVASPIYEVISVAVERDFLGTEVKEPTLWESFKLMGVEIKKALFILLVSVALFIIPGLNLAATLITAFLVGWGFYDYPIARRGWSFRRRLQFVAKDFIAVTAYGLWLMIPFVQFFMMPLAVAGGTLLSLESLKKKALLQDYLTK